MVFLRFDAGGFSVDRTGSGFARGLRRDKKSETLKPLSDGDVLAYGWSVFEAMT